MTVTGDSDCGWRESPDQPPFVYRQDYRPGPLYDFSVIRPG